MRNLYVILFLFPFFVKAEISEVSRPLEYQDKNSTYLSFLEHAGQKIRFGFMKKPNGSWVAIPPERPPLHVKNWNLYFNNKLHKNFGDIGKNAKEFSEYGGNPLVWLTPELNKTWEKLSALKLSSIALQADGFVLMRPLILTNASQLQDPDEWGTLIPASPLKNVDEGTKNAFLEEWQPLTWLQKKGTKTSCFSKADENSNKVWSLSYVSEGSGARTSYFSTHIDSGLNHFFEKRALHFKSKKTGAKIVQLYGTFYSGQTNLFGCNIIPYKSSDNSEFAYQIFGQDTRYAFFMPKDKPPIFLGHDFNLVDVADLDGDGKSEIIGTVSNMYQIISADGKVVAKQPLFQEP